MNDLPPSASTSSVFLFADDTKCLKTIRNISDCLSMQKDLQNLTIWSQCWKLNFNVAKCVLLCFSSGCSSVIFNYTINDNLISAQETHRDLGIIMSSDLSWREHMKSILCRAYKTLNLVRRSFRRGHSPQTKKIIYSGAPLNGHPSIADTHDITDNSESPDRFSIDFNTSETPE